ncbi:unnamed protein product [Effrenium voratum]|nr:unnamed protein product [Effrenium voratum]
MGDSSKQMTQPALSMVCASFFLAVPAAVCALIALLGVWWSGQVEPGTFGGAITGKGDLSLWWFRTSSDFLGINLPQAYINLSSVCLDAFSMCDKLAAIRNLIGVSFGFACLATLCAVMSLFAVNDCFGYGRRIGRFSQMAVCLASALSCGCMIAGLVVGESTDTLQWFRKWGNFGPAVYCAVASLLLSFAAVIVSIIATRRINDENKGAREFQSEGSEATEVAAASTDV